MSLVGPNKVKARKSFLFTEGSLKVENNSIIIHTRYISNVFTDFYRQRRKKDRTRKITFQIGDL